MNVVDYGFDDTNHVVHTVPIPFELFLPAAHLILAVMLLRRFSRNMKLGGAVIYASIGAWLGTLLPAALIEIIPAIGTGAVLQYELGLLGLSLIGATCGLSLRKNET